MSVPHTNDAFERHINLTKAADEYQQRLRQGVNTLNHFNDTELSQDFNISISKQTASGDYRQLPHSVPSQKFNSTY